MTRFQWHIENGLYAWIPPGGITVHKDTQIRHALCNIEVTGQKEPIEALFTLPVDYMKDDKVKEIGVVLGHNLNADWKGKLLTALALALAAEGYVVARYYCKQKDQRRVRLFEKTLDAFATSPFGRTVERWVLGGIGNGARVAAITAGQCRGDMAGFVLISYPLMEPMPPGTKRKNGPPTSEGPLLALRSPVLFLQGDSDKENPPAELATAATQRMCVPNSDGGECPDVRLVVLQEADAELNKPGGGRGGVSMPVVRKVTGAVLSFLEALTSSQEPSMQSCSLPTAAAFLQQQGGGGQAQAQPGMGMGQEGGQTQAQPGLGSGKPAPSSNAAMPPLSATAAAGLPQGGDGGAAPPMVPAVAPGAAGGGGGRAAAPPASGIGGIGPQPTGEGGVAPPRPSVDAHQPMTGLVATAGPSGGPPTSTSLQAILQHQQRQLAAQMAAPMAAQKAAPPFAGGGGKGGSGLLAPPAAQSPGAAMVQSPGAAMMRAHASMATPSFGCQAGSAAAAGPAPGAVGMQQQLAPQGGGGFPSFMPQQQGQGAGQHLGAQQAQQGGQQQQAGQQPSSQQQQQQGHPLSPGTLLVTNPEGGAGIHGGLANQHLAQFFNPNP